MATTVDGLFLLSETFLVICEQALATTVRGTPSRSYISPASPAFDCCDFLTVHAAALTEEATSPLAPAPVTGKRTEFGRIALATLVATAVRCTGDLDEQGIAIVTQAEAVAQAVQQDGWAIWNGLSHAIKCGTFEGICQYVHIDLGRSIPEQGGCVGWQFTIRAELEGIPNPGCGSGS